jgi:hypothetical protein
MSSVVAVAAASQRDSLIHLSSRVSEMSFALSQPSITPSRLGSEEVLGLYRTPERLGSSSHPLVALHYVPCIC